MYVPKGVQVSIPLQSYFRLNAKGAGQFEHTLIIVDEGASLHFIEGCSAPKYNVANLHAGCVELYVKKGAKLRYSTIENWSKNMYNLNTKRALVEEDGTIEWISGSFGSHVGCLYPMSILKGDRARMEFTGVTFAGAGQNLDTGAKVVHVGKNTSSYMNTRSISKSGGITTCLSASPVVQMKKPQCSPKYSRQLSHNLLSVNFLINSSYSQGFPQKYPCVNSGYSFRIMAHSCSFSTPSMQILISRLWIMVQN